MRRCLSIPAGRRGRARPAAAPGPLPGLATPAALALLAAVLAHPPACAEAWRRHTIDDSGRGADGVRLADFDGDGRDDIVTGWEESGHIRLYLNPGPEEATAPWPAVTVGRLDSPEDAVPADIDGDGNWEIVSSHEGRTRAIVVHSGPRRAADESPAAFRRRLLDPDAWSSRPVEEADGAAQWMFATPLDYDGRHALAVGAKGGDALVGLLIPPAPGEAERPWRLIRLLPAGWVMSIEAVDMNGDGRDDLVISDRRGPRRGVSILQRPPDDRFTDPAQWKRIEVGGGDHEVMFLDAAPGRIDVATGENEWLRFSEGQGGRWDVEAQPNPPDLRLGKAVRRLPGAGQPRWVFTFEAQRSDRPVPGVWHLGATGDAQPISHTTGGKYDLIELRDLDGDGDADVITCEERQNLGVVWYENTER